MTLKQQKQQMHEVIVDLKQSNNIDTHFKQHPLKRILAYTRDIMTKRDFIIQWLKWKETTRVIIVNNIVWITSEERPYYTELTREVGKRLFEELEISLQLSVWFVDNARQFFPDLTKSYDQLVSYLRAKLGDFMIDNSRNIYYNRNNKVEKIDTETARATAEERKLNLPIDLDRLDKFSPIWYETFYYNPVDSHDQVDRIFDGWANNNPDTKKMLFSLIGHCLMLKNKLGMVAILSGSGANGKSEFIKLFAKVVGEFQVNTYGNPSYLREDSIELGKMFNGNKVICYHETKEKLPPKAINLLKQCTDPTTKLLLRVKFNPLAKVTPPQNHIFASNYKVDIVENTSAVTRRFYWILFDADFSKPQKNFISEAKLAHLSNDTNFLNAIRTRALNTYFGNGNEIYETEQSKMLKKDQMTRDVDLFLSYWKEGFEYRNIRHQLDTHNEKEYSFNDIYLIYGYYKELSKEQPMIMKKMRAQLKLQKVIPQLIWYQKEHTDKWTYKRNSKKT